MSDQFAGAGGRGATWWLRVEFTALFLVAPLLMAVLLPAHMMFPALFSTTAIGFVLLALTPGFAWRDLLKGWRAPGWRAALLLGLSHAAAARPAAQRAVAKANRTPARRR